MKQIIAFLVFWISFLSCQSEEINIYTQHVKEISKNKDGWNLVWSEEFEQESNIPMFLVPESAAAGCKPRHETGCEVPLRASALNRGFRQ